MYSQTTSTPACGLWANGVERSGIGTFVGTQNKHGGHQYCTSFFEGMSNVGIPIQLLI